MQFHWPSLALGILGVLMVIAGVNGSYRTVWPALAASFRLPATSERIPTRSEKAPPRQGGTHA